MDGLHHVNQVFLDGVRVPKENLIGAEGQGWTIAKFLLGHERTGIAGVGTSKAHLGRLKRIAAEQLSNGRPLIEDPLFRRKVAELEIDLMALEYTNLQILSAESAGEAPGPESSLLKVKGTLVQQRIAELLREAVGNRAHPYSAEAMAQGWGNADPLGPDYAALLAPHYFGWRKSSIYGGSNEIQRGIIAKQVLGL
ncbi:MAG: acyl-CoA dehydrogenase family protein, partial [Alphaproteobacteria bacterium]